MQVENGPILSYQVRSNSLPHALCGVDYRAPHAFAACMTVLATFSCTSKCRPFVWWPRFSEYRRQRMVDILHYNALMIMCETHHPPLPLITPLLSPCPYVPASPPLVECEPAPSPPSPFVCPSPPPFKQDCGALPIVTQSIPKSFCHGSRTRLL